MIEERMKNYPKSKRKQTPRSNHKHEYRRCLFRKEENAYGKNIVLWHEGEYCGICGRKVYKKFYLSEEHIPKDLKIVEE